MKPLSQAVKEKLSKLMKVIDEIVVVGNAIEKKFPSDSPKEFLNVQLSLFSRFINRMKVINILLKEIENNPTIEDSIGLILRGGLADLIPMYYLLTLQIRIKSETDTVNDDNLTIKTKAFLGDHIYKLLWFLKDSKDKGIGEFKTNENYIKSVDRLKEKYPGYFKEEPIAYENPYQNVDAEKFPNNSAILKDIRESPIEDDVKINEIYEMYSFYSKYEHYGVLTKELQRMDIDILIGRIFYTIRYFIIGTNICCIYFDYKFKNISEEKQLLMELQNKYTAILAK